MFTKLIWFGYSKIKFIGKLNQSIPKFNDTNYRNESQSGNLTVLFKLNAILKHL